MAGDDVEALSIERGLKSLYAEMHRLDLTGRACCIYGCLGAIEHLARGVAQTDLVLGGIGARQGISLVSEPGVLGFDHITSLSGGQRASSGPRLRSVSDRRLGLECRGRRGAGETRAAIPIRARRVLVRRIERCRP